MLKIADIRPIVLNVSLRRVTFHIFPFLCYFFDYNWCSNYTTKRKSFRNSRNFLLRELFFGLWTTFKWVCGRSKGTPDGASIDKSVIIHHLQDNRQDRDPAGQQRFRRPGQSIEAGSGGRCVGQSFIERQRRYQSASSSNLRGWSCWKSFEVQSSHVTQPSFANAEPFYVLSICRTIGTITVISPTRGFGVHRGPSEAVRTKWA